MRHLKLFENFDKKDGLVVYLHGLDSQPGVKAEWLATQYSQVYSPDIDYRSEDNSFEDIVSKLDVENISLIIGSSMGGYYAYWICKKFGVPGLLFNPALSRRSIDVPDVDTTGKKPATFNIVLGEHDDVVDPTRTLLWLEENESQDNYTIHKEDIGHRIPVDVFKKYVDDCMCSALDERSGELFHPPKKSWVQVDKDKYKEELEDEFYQLISKAYEPIGGHSKVKKPGDVFKDPDWTFWKGMDIHGSPDFDLIVWGKKTKYGIKYSGVGHDGEKETKREYLRQRAVDLHKHGYYIEVSGKLAEILINKYNVPTVDNREDVDELLPKEFKWHGDHPNGESSGHGWYTRMIGGEPHTKIILGRPKV